MRTLLAGRRNRIHTTRLLNVSCMIFTTCGVLILLTEARDYVDLGAYESLVCVGVAVVDLIERLLFLPKLGPGALLSSECGSYLKGMEVPMYICALMALPLIWLW